MERDIVPFIKTWLDSQRLSKVTRVQSIVEGKISKIQKAIIEYALKKFYT